MTSADSLTVPQVSEANSAARTFEKAAAQPHLGNQLRAIRLAQRRSFAEVAGATDISASFLSLVESGRSDISIGRLMRLTAYYGVGLADVLPHDDASGVEVIRGAEHRTLPSDNEHMVITLLTHHGNRVMRPILVALEEGGGMSEMIDQPGEVFVYVLEGEVTVDIGNHEPIVLHAGDTLYMPDGTARRYRNTGQGQTA